MAREQWWPARSLPDGYEVSDRGRVKGSRGILSTRQDKDGYNNVAIRAGGNRRIHRRVARLVCEAFHGSPPSKAMIAGHRNGDHGDDRAENLFWTFVRNHPRIVEPSTRGEGHGNAVLTEEMVNTLRRRFDHARRTGRETLTSFCRCSAPVYGVTYSAVYHVVTRRTWKHLPDPG